MKRICIAICDDEKDHLLIAEKQIRQIMAESKTEFEIFTFSEPEELLQNGQIFDIAILDIKFKHESGIELAKTLNEKMPQCRIIFLTSYIEFAPDVYETEHIWFVLKLDSSEKLEKAIQKALRTIESKNKEDHLVVKKKSTITRILLKDILYITKVDRKTEIHCRDHIYFDSRNLDELISKDLKDSFLRCHQGYIVNSFAIKELDKNEFVLINNERIPISRKYKESAKNKFFEKFRIQ